MKLREADFIMPVGECDTVINCDGNPSVSAFRAKDIANKAGIHKDIFNHKQRKSVLYSEMYAIYKALQWALAEKRCSIIHTDSKQAAWIIRGLEIDSRKNINDLKEKIRKLLLETSSKVEWVKRSKNNSAHILTKQ